MEDVEFSMAQVAPRLHRYDLGGDTRSLEIERGVANRLLREYDEMGGDVVVGMMVLDAYGGMTEFSNN